MLVTYDDGRVGRMGIVDLGPVAGQVRDVALGLADEQLDGVTPCDGYAVRDVLAHVLGLSVAFRGAAEKANGAAQNAAPTKAELPADWRERLPGLLDDLAEAWRTPDAWDGMTRVGGVDLPGSAAGAVAANELVLHGWDLARAVGARYEPDGAAVHTAYGFVSSVAESTGGKGQDGLFGPAVAVAEDAPLFDRLLGLSGRTPTWTP